LLYDVNTAAPDFVTKSRKKEFSKTNVRAILARVTMSTATKQVSAGHGNAAQARKARGDRTRQAILEAAVDIASAEGLEGLTIGRLASELSMSKSGLFAHFGSKEELQLATVEAARDIFIREVIRPSFTAAKGLTRLWKLCDVWLAYVRGEVFRGGCFFAAAAAEFDGRPGPVRDRLSACAVMRPQAARCCCRSTAKREARARRARRRGEPQT
jgi:AcrR family transcriptional regulator